MKVQFVPRHFVPGVKFTPVRQRVSEYIASTIAPFSDHHRNNCVIKGIAAVEQTPYDQIFYRFRLGRRGVVSSEVYSYLNHSMGYRRITHNPSSVTGFAKGNPRGRFVLLVSKHLVTVIDGVIMDDVNSERMRVKAVWKWEGPVK
jgi:hypothetical protein